MAEALECLKHQTYKDYETLVYDDGSTDGTFKILERAAETDPRLRIVETERLGLVGALSALVAASDAPFLARMDADDNCTPNRLEVQMRALRARSEVAALGSRVTCFPESAVRDGMRRYVDWLNSLLDPEEIKRDMFVESPLCHPSVVIRRDAYDDVGGYLDDGHPEDYGLWLRIHQEGYSMAKTPEVLVSWRESPTRLTRTDERYTEARFLALKLKTLLLCYPEMRRGVVICGTGPISKTWRRALEEEGIGVVRFVDVDLQKIGRTLGGVEVITFDDLAQYPPEALILSCVGSLEARRNIRAFLRGHGMVETRDFVCVA